MRYQRLSVHLVHATILLGCLTTPLAPRWDDLIMKHSWSAVPASWEKLGLPPVGITIDLHTSLELRRKNA